EELRGALSFEREQPALDRADARGRHVAVVGLELRGIVADVLEYGAQVFQVEQQQTVVVGDLEYGREHAFLCLVELENAGKQQRSQVGYRRAHRVAELAEDVPEHRRTTREDGHLRPDLLNALLELR